MRTNVVIDDALMAEAMELTGLRTKREIVDAALRDIVQRHRQGRAIERLWGSVPNWDGDIDAWRRADAPVEWDGKPA